MVWALLHSGRLTGHDFRSALITFPKSQPKQHVIRTGAAQQGRGVAGLWIPSWVSRKGVFMGGGV